MDIELTKGRVLEKIQVWISDIYHMAEGFGNVSSQDRIPLARNEHHHGRQFEIWVPREEAAKYRIHHQSYVLR